MKTYQVPDGMPDLPLDNREWSTSQAKEYLTWLLAIRGDRMAYLSKALGLALKGTPRERVLRFSNAALPFFKQGEFMKKSGTATGKGGGLALDLAIVLGDALVEEHPNLKWGIVKRGGKRMVDFNRPGILGFDGIPAMREMDPRDAVLATVRRFLRDPAQREGLLAEEFDEWSGRAPRS